jgi:hypothetical protein
MSKKTNGNIHTNPTLRSLVPAEDGSLECGSALLFRFGFSPLAFVLAVFRSEFIDQAKYRSKRNSKTKNKSGRAKHCRTPNGPTFNGMALFERQQVPTQSNVKRRGISRAHSQCSLAGLQPMET